MRTTCSLDQRTSKRRSTKSRFQLRTRSMYYAHLQQHRVPPTPDYPRHCTPARTSPPGCKQSRASIRHASSLSPCDRHGRSIPRYYTNSVSTVLIGQKRSKERRVPAGGKQEGKSRNRAAFFEIQTQRGQQYLASRHTLDGYTIKQRGGNTEVSSYPSAGWVGR